MTVNNRSVHTSAIAVGGPKGTLPNPLTAALRSACRRIRVLLLLRSVSRALCLTSGVCLIAVICSKLRLIDKPSPDLFGLLIGAGLLLAVVFALTRRVADIDVAKLTERRLDLKERLSSAVEFHDGGVAADAPFYREQLADATRSASEASLKTAFPIRLPRLLYLGVACLAALVAIYFIPNLPIFWTPQHKLDAAEVKRRGIEIVRLSEDKQKTADQQKLPETRKAAAEVKKIGESMSHGQMTKKESLIALQKLTKKLDDSQRKLAESEAAKIKAAAADLKQSLDKMEKDMERRAADKKAAELARNQPGMKSQQPLNPSQPTPNSPAQSQAMQQSKEAMQQMAEALANMDHQQMQQAMEKMARQMESGNLSKEEMKQLEHAMRKMAEALKNSGQNSASQEMQQLAEQMSSGQMSPEALQQMAAMARSIGQKMAKGEQSKEMLDAKELAELSQALRQGRLTTVMGSMPGQPNGPGRGKGGHGPGRGSDGQGEASTPMKDPGATNGKLLVAGSASGTKGVGRSGSAADFMKYAAMSNKASGHLPNGKIAGARSANGQELEINMTGDPQSAKSNSPYYQVYQTSKKQAEDSLNKENIPAAYKDQVRKYFEEIRP